MNIVYRRNGEVVSQEEFLAGSEGGLQQVLDARQAPRAITDATFLTGHCNGN